jgi:hypothetical protein
VRDDGAGRAVARETSAGGLAAQRSRYAVIIDQAVPRIGWGAHVGVGKGQAVVIGHFESLDAARLFAESARHWDLRRDLGLGRLRVLDRLASEIVHEVSASGEQR